MSDTAPELGRATAGQLRRAGFQVAPPDTDDSATQGFEILTSFADDASRSEFERARKRGDHLPGEKGKP